MNAAKFLEGRNWKLDLSTLDFRNNGLEFLEM
jgi:hypothetical protein